MAEKESGGKKPKAKKKKQVKSQQYKITGNAVERKKFCPKCGPGVFLAEHSNRHACGKCSYTAWK